MKKIDDEMLKEILTEMLRRVNAKETYEEFDFEKDKWFELYTWTEKEQEDFQKWLGEYLVKHKVTKKGKVLQRYTGMFLLDYGWKGNYEAN